MSEIEIIKKIKEILLKGAFDIKEEITVNTIIKKFPEWDSFKHLAFMIEIEDQFNIEITPEDFTIIETIGDLLERINK